MTPEIMVALIGAVEAIGVAIIGGLIARNQKRSDEQQTAREQRDACLYDLVFAVASGTEVLLHNAHGEKVNGNVDEALASIHDAKGECNRVFNRQVAKL